MTAINQSGIKCWCPSCDEHNKKIGIIGFWISPKQVHVCDYAICKDCAVMMRSLPEVSALKKMNEIEISLIGKYPNLWGKLPSDFCFTDELGKFIYRKPME